MYDENNLIAPGSLSRMTCNLSSLRFRELWTIRNGMTKTWMEDTTQLAFEAFQTQSSISANIPPQMGQALPTLP